MPRVPCEARLSHLTRVLSAFLGGGVGTRRAARVTMDCLIWVVALILGLSLRLDFNLARMESFDVVVLIPVAWLATIGFGYLLGLYRGWWTLGSFEEVPALGLCAGLTTVTLIIVDVLTRSDRLAPVTSLVAAGLIVFVAMGGPRHLLRRAVDHHRRALGDGRVPDHRVRRRRRRSAHHSLDAVRDGQPVPPGCSPRRRPDEAQPLRAWHPCRRRPRRHCLGRRAHDASALVIAVPTGDGALIRELSESARLAGLDVRVVPSVDELLTATCTSRDLRAPTESDLLGRHTIETDLVAVSEYIQGRRVVVTGAGGSIGSELCRQIAAFGPRAPRDDRPRRVRPPLRSSSRSRDGRCSTPPTSSSPTSATGTASSGDGATGPTWCSMPPR